MESPWSRLHLPAKILKKLRELQFKFPTDVQKKVIPSVLMGRNLTVISPPGSGKTHVYLIPIWVLSKQKTFQSLVIVPTRELGYQVSKMFQQLVPGSRSRIRLLTGGKSQGSRNLMQNPLLLIATPGRLVQYLTKDEFALNKTALLVLDEFDKLLALGFEEQIRKILEKLPGNIQRLGFSATDTGGGFSREVFQNESSVTITENPEIKTSVETIYYFKSSKIKNKLCFAALEKAAGQTLVFVKNAAKANHLKGYLKLKGVACETLHGKLKQKERNKIYQKFMDKKFPVLVATDLAARGLDTLRVNTVLNFDLPINADIYTHRKGRSGRTKQDSFVINYAGPDDYLCLKKIEKGLGRILPAHKDFAEREIWLKAARSKHQQKVKREKRLREIKTKQGLI